jgi:hypothetical protein
MNSCRRSKRVSESSNCTTCSLPVEAQPKKKKSQSSTSTPVPTNTASSTSSRRSSLHSRRVQSADRGTGTGTGTVLRVATESLHPGVHSNDDMHDVSEDGEYERELHVEHCERFWRFVHERQEIWRKKSAGEPAPWTSDPILRYNSFTNVYRELDRGTLYLQQHLKHVNSNNNNNSPSQVTNTPITCQHTHQTCHRCCGSV